MLGLDVQEQSQLHLLESSLSNTVNHKWPILHVHFIDEPIPDWDIKEQGDLTTKNQKHPLPQKEIINSTGFIPVPEPITCTGSQDCGRHYSLNSAVMLDTVESIAPMDISSPTQKMDLQESAGSSGLQDREDFLEMDIDPEVTTELHVKDNQLLNEPPKAACIKDMSSEIGGLHSEQNASLNNLHLERNKCADLKESDSSQKLTEKCCLVTDLQNSFEQLSGGHQECTVVKSSEHTCLSNDLIDGDSCTCLEDQEVPLYSSISHNMTSRNLDSCDGQKGPVLCKETCSKCSDIGEIGCTSISEGSMTENDIRPKQICLEHAVQNVAQSKDICVQQSLDVTSCTEDQCKKDTLCTHLTTTHFTGKVETSLGEVHPPDISDDNLLSESWNYTNFTELETMQPNLQASIDALSAKSCDTQECSFLPNTSENNVNLQSVSADYCEDLSCASNTYKSGESWHASSINSVPAKSTSSCKGTLLTDEKETFAVHIGDSDTTGQEQDVKERLFQVETFLDKEVMMPKSPHDGIMTQEMYCTISQENILPHILNGAQSPAACSSTQIPELHNSVPNLGHETISSCKIATSYDSMMRIKNDKSSGQQAESNLICKVSDSENPNAIAKCENSLFFSHSQGSESLSVNKTILVLNLLKEANCQAPPPPEYQSAAHLNCPLEIPLQNALVPYVDIWNFLTKPNTLSTNNTNNLIIKSEKLQKLKLANDLSYDKESSFLLAKACSVPDRLTGRGDAKHSLLVNFSVPLHSMKALLLKCPDDTVRFTRNLLRGRSAWSPRVKKSNEGKPTVNPTLSQIKWVSSSGSNINNFSACYPVGKIRVAEKSSCYSQASDSCLRKTETLAHPLLPSSRIDQSAASPADILATSWTKSEVERTQRIEHSPIKHMVTRSRNKNNLKASSEYFYTMKPIQSSTSPKDETMKQSILVGEQRPQFKLLKGQFGEKTPPELTVGTLKRKRICIKTEKTLPTNVKKPLPLHHDQQLPKDCLRQPACCQLEMEVIRADKSVESCTLKLEPQSLTCTMQGVKRPKTSHENLCQPSSSGLQGCIDTGCYKTLSLHPRSQRPFCKIQKVSDFQRNTYMNMTGDLSLRRQPSRKCKSSFMQEYNVPNSNIQTCKSSKAFQTHSCQIPNHRLLPSKHAVSNIASNKIYGRVIRRDVVTLNKFAAEKSLLHQLSAIASRLTAPCKSSLRSTASSSTTKLVPFKGVQLQARRLLNVFSCVNMKISSQLAENVDFSSSRDHLLSQCMDICPSDLTKVCPDILARGFSLPVFDDSTFPVSFHMKIDSGFLSDFIKFNPPDYMFKSVLPLTQSAQLSEWTLSFFLSPHFPATSDGIQLFTHWNPHFKCLGTFKSDSSCRGIFKRKSGCSMLGLHTVLALSSPGCYRLWTRKRNLGSRIPTVQKLSVTQFAHGLKGLPPQFSWKREMSASLAFSLGRVMSMWSRHGIPAFSSDFATPHPHCSLRQPNQTLSISMPVLNPSTEVIPKNCLRHCIPALSRHSSCLFLEKGVGLRPSCSLFTKQGSSVCLPSQQQANLGLSVDQTSVIEPSQSLSTEHNYDLGHLRSLSIEQDGICEPSNFLCSEQANNINSLEPLHCFTTRQGKEFGPSLCLSVQKIDAPKTIHSLPLHQVKACQLPNEQGGGPGPACSLSTEEGDGLQHSYDVSIEHISCLVPLCNFSNTQPSSIKALQYLTAHQDFPRFPHLAKEQAMGLGLSEVLSSDQGDGLKTSCLLSPQQTDSLGAPLSSSPKKKCEFEPHDLSILQDRIEPPCILIPSKTQAHPFEQRESLPIPHAKTRNQKQENEKEEVERKPQRVSQIRIRKTIPKPDPNLTPMGLPKPKRINKKEFSLEDIYTNKNYKSPPPVRSLETIFEEPKEKNGVLVSVSQTKRKRILEFRDCTVPRPKRTKGKVRVMATCKRGRKAAMEGMQLDALLIQKLMDLEKFFSEQEALEQGSAAAEEPS